MQYTGGTEDENTGVLKSSNIAPGQRLPAPAVVSAFLDPGLSESDSVLCISRA